MTVHYVGRWAFGGIEVLTPPDDYPDMGFHNGGKFTRLDIAIDDRKPYLDISEVRQKIKNRECVSKFRNWTSVDGGTMAGKKAGCTVNLGSRPSFLQKP